MFQIEIFLINLRIYFLIIKSISENFNLLHKAQNTRILFLGIDLCVDIKYDI